MIDVNKFKEMYKEIDEKVQKIRVLPMLRPQEQDYMGFEIDGDEIIVNSEYHYSGCGTDYSYLIIPLDEIGNSIEWFREKFQNEIDEFEKIELERELEEKRQKEEQAKRFAENQRKKDLETYERIKKELENGKL